MVFRRKLTAWVPLSWVRDGWTSFFYPLPLPWWLSGEKGGYGIRPYKRLRFRASLHLALPECRT
jgi:hypothetical protein